MLSLNGPVLIASTRPAAWQREGVEWLTLPADASGRVEFRALFDALVERDINEVHVEAGPTLSGALFEAALVDELVVYQAPVLLGAGAAMLALPGMEKFEQRCHLDLVETRRVGVDWRHRFTRSS